jgi:hypothetical protein
MAEDLQRHEAIALDVLGIDHETPSGRKARKVNRRDAEVQRRKKERIETADERR